MFDLPNTIVSTVNENWEDGYMKLSQCSKLPELRDRPSDFYQKMKINDRGKSFKLCVFRKKSFGAHA